MRIDELADDYLKAVNSAINQLQSELAVKNLLDAWLQRQIPQRGTLEDGASFQFHGIGCAVERTDDIDVDFDFNHDGSAAKIDAWRLWRFAKQFPEKYPTFQRRDTVAAALEEYLGPQGKNPEFPPN